jgi:hypothetical protein
MGNGYTVDVDQLRAHAKNIDSLKERFGAVRDASSHIAQNDEAYGLLCGWIAAVLEGRHQKQDELVTYVEENLTLVAQSLRDTADDYEEMEATNTDTMTKIQGDLGQVPR